jgi:glycolate oxidase FAD binding subunit
MTQDMPGARMDHAQAARDWQACRELTLPFFKPASDDLCLWRLSVPQTAPVLGLPWAQLVEWHGGQRWLWAPLSAQSSLRQAAAAAGGSATVFLSPKAINTPARGRFSPLKPPLDGIHKRLKAEFDPAGIFNPGRLYPDF